MQTRWLNRASLLAPYLAVALLLGSSAAQASVATSATTTTTGPAIKVNPLSQHASHCAQPYSGYLDCFVTLKNTKTVVVSWWMENQRQSSDNVNENSTLYANGSSGNYVAGNLNPGQSVTVEIGTSYCTVNQYWTWIVLSWTNLTTFAPQATILACY